MYSIYLQLNALGVNKFFWFLGWPLIRELLKGEGRLFQSWSFQCIWRFSCKFLVSYFYKTSMVWITGFKMACVNGIEDCEMLYKIKFGTVIRGHHVYKAILKPTIGEELYAKHDEREEAKEFDEFAVCIYHAVDMKKLVRHIPIKLSSLMYNFLVANDNNSLRVIIAGKFERSRSCCSCNLFCIYRM